MDRRPEPAGRSALNHRTDTPVTITAMERREFLQWLTAATAAGTFGPTVWAEPDGLGGPLPVRTLGHTGEKVTCLGLGGFHIGWTTEKLAQATIEAALAEGVRFFDTAESYGRGASEQRYGRHLVPRHRDRVFLMTKSGARGADEARKHLEGSLRRMKTDVIDLWQLHAIGSAKDVDQRLSAGVLDAALKAREEGKVRYIGFTGHANPEAHRRLLERTAGDEEPFAACQFPVNVVDAAAKVSFTEMLFPLLAKRRLGVLAMKTLADGRFFGRKTMGERTVWKTDDPIVPATATVGDCIRFVLSLPVTVLITGAEKPEFIREKARLVRQFAKMSEDERRELVGRVSDFAEAGRVEYYKAG